MKPARPAARVRLDLGDAVHRRPDAAGGLRLEGPPAEDDRLAARRAHCLHPNPLSRRQVLHLPGS